MKRILLCSVVCSLLFPSVALAYAPPPPVDIVPVMMKAASAKQWFENIKSTRADIAQVDPNSPLLESTDINALEKEANAIYIITSIDDYLCGSVLEGYGRAFYEAATAYGIDYRLLPAISCIESGKGSHCFRSYNAWGWGGINWSSWEESIWAVASGISRGYGKSATPESMGSIYCPTSNVWASNVRNEMEKM
jgi:peptidoglycan DL-endopeptidase CwlO